MSLANFEVRQAIEKKRLRHYEVAELLNITPETFSKWMRHEMEPDKKEKILKAISDFQG